MLAPGAAALDEYKYVGSDDFYVCRVSADPNNGGLTRRFRDADGRYLSNTPLITNSVSNFAIVFEPALRIPAGGRLGIELVNGSMADVQDNLRITGYRKFYEGDTMNRYAAPVEYGVTGDTPPGFRDVPFIYNFDVASIAANTAPGILPLKIDNDADFVWRAGAFIAESGNADFVWLRFTDGEGRYRMNTRIPAGAIFALGSGYFAPLFPEIHLPGGCSVYFDVANTDANPVTNFQLSMAGVKRTPR